MATQRVIMLMIVEFFFVVLFFSLLLVTLICCKRKPQKKDKWGSGYLHTGALLAASVSRAHVWAAVSNVEVIQSPGLLFVKGSLLEPAEPRGWRPEDTNQSGAIKSCEILFLHTHLSLIYLA